MAYTQVTKRQDFLNEAQALCKEMGWTYQDLIQPTNQDVTKFAVILKPQWCLIIEVSGRDILLETDLKALAKAAIVRVELDRRNAEQTPRQRMNEMYMRMANK